MNRLFLAKNGKEFLCLQWYPASYYYKISLYYLK